MDAPRVREGLRALDVWTITFFLGVVAIRRSRNTCTGSQGFVSCASASELGSTAVVKAVVKAIQKMY